MKHWDGSAWIDDEDRSHSDANEATERSIDGLDSGHSIPPKGGHGTPSGVPEFLMEYDKNGNLISQMVPTIHSDSGDHVLITYTYDAWNRLVAVDYDEIPRARYVYNGLNWRIAKRSGTWNPMPFEGGITLPPAEPLDQERRMYYSANHSGGWQLLEEHIDDDVDEQVGFDADRHMQYVWGVRYIDDIIVRREDTDLNGSKAWYHLTDTLFSTVAILDGSAKRVERVSYDAYGNARHHRAGDLDGDCATTSADAELITDSEHGSMGDYGVGDINRDGLVDRTDVTLVNADMGPALAAGHISQTDNIIGYAGYVFNPEMHGSGLYLARNRYYDAVLGRWLTRDPIGYVDGMGLYEYVRSRPINAIDPHGTKSVEDRPGPASTCRIAVRCGPAKKSGIRFGTHCGLVVCDDWGCQSWDGSGGDINTWHVEDPPGKHGTTYPATTLSGSVCDCLRQAMRRWNNMRVPRDSGCRNSNWSLRCLLGRWGMTIDWGSKSAPTGWNCRRCVDWKYEECSIVDSGFEFYCVKWELMPCP